MASRILAGDIGGTKTNLALYEAGDRARLEPLRERSFPSREHQALGDIIADFDPGPVSAAAFGIAGPVFGDEVRTTNLPWQIRRDDLTRVLGCPLIRLMNDLETTAFGALFLPDDQIAVLREGIPRGGNRAVIAAGTGLGQAILFRDGDRLVPSATEGGHADFAPRSEKEIGLLQFLQQWYGRVSYERVVSGPGLHNVFRYLVEELGREPTNGVLERTHTSDPGAVIGEAGASGACPVCEEAVDLFVDIYGAQAGNLALTTLAVGGIYVGGGIVVKLLAKFREGGFLEAFTRKGRYEEMMTTIPIRVILEPKTSLLGAAHAAREALTSR